MKSLKYIVVVLLVLAFSANANAQANFNVVYKVITSADNQLFLVTDNGTWKVDGQYIVRVDSVTVEKLKLANFDFPKPVLSFNHVSENPSWHGIFIVIVGILLCIALFILQRDSSLKDKQYMTTLRQQKRLMDLCFWVTGDIVLDCDLEQNFVEKITDSKLFFDLDGITFLSDSYLNQIHPDDKSMFQTQYQAILAAGHNRFQLMYRFSDNNGDWRWIVERGCVIERASNGEAKRIVTNLRDESELRREQNNLVRINHALEKKIAAIKVQEQANKN
ncbi:PAS domain-containing protein [Psychrosphaera sp. B3R10]|uniref:PAS domain-containing protein n=1 Tax=unclassified Psychrosphaera TaxID=2641570 RepID=UPI001C084769|nr:MULTISPECIES: PAS domain-containing protein [unclassified Psychrosphaera]MBU2882949.1 PAS domain-containing protein [Psychrosphaera sp. I2R16]MBU2991346.1 PAS domain-containing protein [Psychrosphaera sp. B3R10]